MCGVIYLALHITCRYDESFGLLARASQLVALLSSILLGRCKFGSWARRSASCCVLLCKVGGGVRDICS